MYFNEKQEVTKVFSSVPPAKANNNSKICYLPNGEIIAEITIE